MVAATEKPESAGEQLEQARDGAEWGRGEVARLWVRGIEAGTTGMADVANGGRPARALRNAGVRKEKGREGMRSFQCSREDKGGAQTPRSGRDRRRVDKLAGVQEPVWASGAHCVEQEKHSVHFDHF